MSVRIITSNINFLLAQISVYVFKGNLIKNTILNETDKYNTITEIHIQYT